MLFIRSVAIYNIAISGAGEVLGIQDVLPSSTKFDSQNKIGEISTFVSLKFHRSGIGRKLSQATFPSAKSIGYSKLIAIVRLDNPRAISFYRSQEFISKAIKNGQYRILEKHLN